jgi:hypothetical protein
VNSRWATIAAGSLMDLIQTSNSEHRILKPTSERINVFVGLSFLLLAIVEIAVDGSPFSQAQAMFLTKVVFLDATHVGLTFPLLFFLPEIRRWRTERVGGNQRLFFQCALIVVSILSVFMFSISLGATHSEFEKLTALVFMELITVINFFHGFYQFRGILKVYSHLPGNPNSQVKLQEFEKNQKWETRAFGLMSALFIVMFISILRLQPNIPIRSVALASWSTGQYVVFSAFLFSVFHFVYWSIRAGFSNRNYYLLRILLLPLLPFSRVAAIGITACHGIEYIFIYFKMIENSTVSKDVVKKIYVSSVVLAVLLNFLSAPMWLAGNPDRNRWFFLMTSGYTAISVVHFYLDRVLFRMRNPITRRVIAPLLSKVS